MESLIGKKAPAFSADAVVNGSEFVEGFSLEQYIEKKEVIFFFYPLDFTFVCPTELLAFQAKLGEFEKRGVAVVGCSVDSSHVLTALTRIEKGCGEAGLPSCPGVAWRKGIENKGKVTLERFWNGVESCSIFNEC